MAGPGTRVLENDNFLQEFKKYVYLPSQFIVGKRSLTLLPGWWNWYTRTSQKRMPHSLRVRVSLRAPKLLDHRSGAFLFWPGFVLKNGGFPPSDNIIVHLPTGM